MEIFSLRLLSSFHTPKYECFAKIVTQFWKQQLYCLALVVETIVGLHMHTDTSTHILTNSIILTEQALVVKKEYRVKNETNYAFEIEYRNVWTLSIKGLFLSTAHTFLSNALIYTLFLRLNPTELTYTLLPPFKSHFQCWFCNTLRRHGLVCLPLIWGTRSESVR